MYILVILFPLLSAFLSGFLGVYLGSVAVGFFSVFSIGLALLFSFLCFYEVVFSGCVVHIPLFTWLSVGPFFESCSLFFDFYTSTMLIVVLFVSFLVHLYSTSYMGSDPHLSRFMCYLSVFTFFMLVFVTASNFLQMFVGWEGVGLSSYLLINFWFTRVQANKSSLKAVVLNRFGDVSLFFAFFAVWFIFRSLDYCVVFSLLDCFHFFYLDFFGYQVHAFSFIAFCLFVGCVAKSAQLGLHTWLPDAMEGPTPVSALIHAATMVTAGVFLLIRCSLFFEFSVLSFYVIVFSSLTIFFAGTVGFFQHDLKKVIAYSTCGQLGYMVLACGLHDYSSALFHLLTHAFFKALLFLSAGSIIHGLLDEQDIRRMGGLVKMLPLTYASFLIGSLALVGFPYTSGYYSKDFILELSFVDIYVFGYFFYFLAIFGVFLTSLYSSKLLFFVFYSEANLNRGTLKYVSESSWLMLFPLIFLTFMSIFAGYIFKDLYLGLGSDFSTSFALASFDFTVLTSEFIPVFIKVFPLFLGLACSFFCFLVYYFFPFLVYSSVFINSSVFFTKKWFFDLIYTSLVAFPVLRFGFYSFRLVDRGFAELVGPTGLVYLVSFLVLSLRILQSGFIFNYVFLSILALFLTLLLTFGSHSLFFILLLIFSSRSSFASFPVFLKLDVFSRLLYVFNKK